MVISIVLNGGIYHFNEIKSTSSAIEWTGRNSNGSLVDREVKIKLDRNRCKVLISNYRNHVFRMIDLRRIGHSTTDDLTATIALSSDRGNRLLVLSVPEEIDLVSIITIIILQLLMNC